MKIKKRFSVVERSIIVENSQKCLGTHEGKPGLDYLLNERGLSEDVIRLFSIGYIPSNVGHQLAGRVILPIYDPSRNLIAVSSRAVEDSYELPVYWHESYEKSFYLYGIQSAKEKISRLPNGIYLVSTHNHGLALIKFNEKQSYIFDPLFGLLETSAGDLLDLILKNHHKSGQIDSGVQFKKYQVAPSSF